MSDHIQFIEKNKVQVLLLDVSGMKPGKEFTHFIDDAQKIIHAKPVNSVRTLFDATGSFFDTETINILKEFTASNKAYVRASAVVGITGLMKMMLDIISRFSGRNFKQCASREEAIEWLIQQ